AVTGYAGGKLSLISPNASMTVGRTGNFGTLSSGGVMSLVVAAGDLTINASVTGSALQIDVNNAVIFAAGTAGAPIVARSTGGDVTLASTTLSMGAFSEIDATGIITVSTTGDATIGRLWSSASFGSLTNAITVAAGGPATTGSIFSNGDGRDNVFTTGSNAGVSLTAGSSGSIGTSAARVIVDTPTLVFNAGGNAYLTVMQALHVTSGVASAGVLSIVGDPSLVLDSLLSGGVLAVASNTGSIAIGTATSGGSQTIHGKTDVTFTTLTANGITGANPDAGDSPVTSDTTKIEGTTVAANGSAALTAATTNKGTSATATTGSINLASTGLIDWTTLNAGTSIDVRSTGGAVSLGTATSGGSQTIRGKTDVTFTTLTANGIPGDAGDISVTADTGAVQGTTVAANRSATLAAATDNTGDTLTATTGDAVLRAGGLIRWNNITAGKTVQAGSTGGSIQFGDVLSGGTQTLTAYNDIVFNRLTTTGTPDDQGDIVLRAINGRVQGSDIVAAGIVDLAGGRDITLNLLQGSSVSLATPQNIVVSQLNVFRSLSLAANTITVTAKQLPFVPPVPLHVIVSGFNGGVATWANLNIDPPVVIIDTYRVTDSTLTVDSPDLTIASGYVPGQMTLNIPAGQVLLDNRGPGPVNGPNLQLYQPGGAFSMSQIGNTNYSDTYVVRYDATISSVITNYGGGPFGGTAFVRNSQEDMQNAGAFDPSNTQRTGLATFHLLGGQYLGFRNGFPVPVEVLGDGPAVNVKGLFETKSSKRGKKSRSTRLRDKNELRLAFGPL
ncbi:MAG: beta strand repeat-containing protein, partial [Pseudolabrys sp.]